MPYGTLNAGTIAPGGGNTLTIDGAWTAASQTCANLGTVTTTGTIGLGGKLTAGSTEIEGSNFDINGGTIDGVTSFNGAEIVTSATSNIGVGIDAVDSISGGDYNVGFGESALTAVTSGDGNSALGHGAGNVVTDGSNNTLIGYLSNVSASDSVYSVVIGSAGCVSIGNYNITMGHGSGTDRISNSPFANATWTRASDVRIKKEITTNKDCGLDFINDLRTVTFKRKAPSELAETMSEYDPEISTARYDKKMYGFIAQEVKEALDAHSITDFAGWNQLDDGIDNLQGISYEMFVMPLVKAVQELSAKVTALENA